MWYIYIIKIALNAKIKDRGILDTKDKFLVIGKKKKVE